MDYRKKSVIKRIYAKVLDCFFVRKTLKGLEHLFRKHEGVRRVVRGLTCPVERDQFLFARTGSGLFVYSLLFTLLTLSVIAVLSVVCIGVIQIWNLCSQSSCELGIFAFDHETGPDSGPNFLWAILCQFLDPGNVVNAGSAGGSFIAIICALSGIVCLSGLLVTSMVNMISRMTEQWKDGLLHYDWHFDRYVVIIGVNDQTAAIARRALLRDDVDYVLIQTRQDVEKMRMRLDLDLDRDEENKLVFYFAERISREDIEELHLEKAVEVYILGENVNFENEEDHDAFNIECLEHISKYMNVGKNIEKRRKFFGQDSRLTCHVEFEYQSTFTVFKATHIYQKLDKVVEFHPFNVHEIWAKKVLVDNFAVIPSGKKGEMTVQTYQPLDGEGITSESQKTVHLIVMGMNQMGTALGMQAALLAHYPNFKKDNNLKTTITFIDDQAIKEGEFLRGRFESLFELSSYRVVDCRKSKLVYSNDRALWGHHHQTGKYAYLQNENSDFMDIRWEFIQGNVANDDVRKYISDVAEDTDHNITTIAICFNHPQQSLATALYLPRTIFNHALQVLTFQQNSFDILNSVANGEKEWKRYKNLYPFGMIDSSYTESVFDDSRAKIVSFLFAKRRDEGAKQRLKDLDGSLIPEIEQIWEYLSLADKQSNMDMVESIPGKLRSMGIDYHGNTTRVDEKLMKENGGDELVCAMAYSEHMRWVTERLIMGYRPLEKTEYESIKTGTESKEGFKSSHRAHLDICSNETLEKVDPKAPQNDKDNILNLPLILRCTEWYNFKSANNKDNNKSMKLRLLQEFLFHEADKEKHLSLRYVEARCANKKGTGNADACQHPFWIADCPVTRGQWYVVTGQDKPGRDEVDMPKVDISKEDVENFLLILRKRTGLYFTLPSKKEWKEAADRSTVYLSCEKDWSKIICFDKEKNGGGPWSARSRRCQQENPLKVYDMVGNVWEWTRSEAERHTDAFYFCGGSWRFKEKECRLDTGYWNTYWASSLREDDLGCRLVWKFDIEPQKAKRLEQELVSPVPAPENNLQNLINHWFERHPMVEVKDGFFVMGVENKNTVEKCEREYPREEPWVCECAEDDETPHHYVRIDKFKICSVPVTQELWNLVMGTTPKTNPSANIGDELPQTNVSYRTIVDDFIVELNRLTGKHYRLPTEAEWEYVAKGGHTHPISIMLSREYEKCGNLKHADSLLKSVDGYSLYAGSDNPDEVAWTKENTHGTRVVGLKKPVSEAFKVYDMSGNVWEWCADYYQSDIYTDCVEGNGRNVIQRKEDLGDLAYPELGFISNPVCLKGEYSAHVFRGGSWMFGAIDSRCTRPNYWIESDEDVDLGFRLALSE